VFVRRLALAIALIAGLLGSQGPEFAQQYRQRIGGALDELKRIVADFDQEAAREQLTPDQAINRLEQNSDPVARERGRDIAQTIARTDRLQEQLDAMQSSSPLNRLYVMAKDFDPETAQRTLDNYEPAAPLSLEALTAAGLAAIWGWAATHLFAWPIRRLRGGAAQSAGKAASR
jgi:exonuclease VII large subunit